MYLSAHSQNGQCKCVSKFVKWSFPSASVLARYYPLSHSPHRVQILSDTDIFRKYWVHKKTLWYMYSLHRYNILKAAYSFFLLYQCIDLHQKKEKIVAYLVNHGLHSGWNNYFITHSWKKIFFLSEWEWHIFSKAEVFQVSNLW